MRAIASVLLYLALVAGANAADIASLRAGDMTKLDIHAAPLPTSAAPFTTPEGTSHTLADWRGKYVLLNFWATWCAPCRHEMPALNALQKAHGGPDFEVVTVATGRNALPAIERFFDEAGIDRLPILLDPKQGLAREMAVLGLPISVLIDREGQEIARLQGDADWASESARAIIAALIARDS